MIAAHHINTIHAIVKLLLEYRETMKGCKAVHYLLQNMFLSSLEGPNAETMANQ